MVAPETLDGIHRDRVKWDSVRARVRWYISYPTVATKQANLNNILVINHVQTKTYCPIGGQKAACTTVGR